ncbi:MAG TPA: 3-hydroxyacyl-[acyl-carrier-protein] dehydratase FabA [Gammaproteobacteria bacterium]|jgi:3-hydroxyacyl-[acyl-carrier protein] dehydratase/trans-2-decenoyl-[acyl-carrier protein] isomerase|nr:3-hydroxyacyl-[acyl-carrier-protein] dehydratase FabA [Gammaproteobacteria bacterium]PHS09896.1 MAG: 3-hydroxyacyl-[acyl-carrier-protein] dehydratase FabA [Acidithiobacillus sp.]RTZ62232.1 MAG: 3-hydroxyacyl-[acyl-carrier-protein] dehydratase FabA [Gammaproteobacteria bacterium]HAD36885.1 3-hydroxyacyl-[acyl-carrier-protein] dehydratase FabA [Gammaproteobacteria bacterium]HBK75681.1 3-hydroxyacyl-[acyl-carrier-protein] dehydratase FabA [Gammaproteobacteria bacterium]
MNSERQNSYERAELLACGRGQMFGDGNAQLPLPPMLMFDRITHISDKGGAYGRGEVIAELDIEPQQWFFTCHFKGDPVMPGCLGVDALWQLMGFFLGWKGGLGHGRALGSGEIRFTGQVTPDCKLVRFQLSLKRVVMRKLVMGIADGQVEADGKVIYTGKDLRVGLFAGPEVGGEI